MCGQNIWSAAFDGDLKAVKKLLAGNPALLDAPFQKTLLGTGIAEATYALKKTFAGMLVFLSYGCAIVETAGVAAILVPGMLGAATVTWKAGDKALEYYKKNLNNWTPLDCAVFGVIQGNKEAEDVVRYLIAKGAQGANSAKDPNKKYFAVLGEEYGNSAIVDICNSEIASRQKALHQAQAIGDNNPRPQVVAADAGVEHAAIIARQQEEIRVLREELARLRERSDRSQAMRSAGGSVGSPANAAVFFAEHTPSQVPSRTLSADNFTLVDRPAGESNSAFRV